MKKNIGAVVIAASMLVATSAMAEKGQWEVSVAGNIDNQSNTTKVGGFSTTSDSTNTFINADVGRYFTPRLVGRVNLSMFGSDSSASKSVGTGVGVGVKFYFGDAAKAKWVPFVQGGLNVVSMESKSGGISSSYSGAGVAGGGGVSYFITEEVSGDISLQGYFNSMSGSGVTLEQSGTRLLFGLTARY